MKKKKLIITLSIILAVILALGGIVAALFPSSWMFSEKTHIARVSRRVERRYMRNNGKYNYTGYTVYPLYNENDKLAFFLVEFEPYGFVYVKLNDSTISIVKSLYTRYSSEGDPWQRYTLGGPDEYDEMEKIFETDESGEYIFYTDSHFKVAGIENERRYLLKILDYRGGLEYIPAVKRGDGYLNLVSMQEFKLTDDDLPQQATAYIHFIGKSHFDL